MTTSRPESPVQWLEWGEEAFARARSEGKLLFLDITAKWCHWCHVLDRTSLADPRVASVLARSYISIRVDTDRRPDLNDRYNQGGWPSVSVLLPDGRTLTGATYLPPDDLLAVLEKCAAFYENDRPRIDAWIAEGEKEEARRGGEGATDSEDASPGEDLLPSVRNGVLSQIDADNPGFFGEPKFLLVEALAFLRDGWVLEPDAGMGGAFVAILRRMIESEVFDEVEGGFFRYATRRDWTVPHYEKLLADNAAMLGLCASAFELTEEPRFAEAARDTLRFLLLTLFDRAGGAFRSSQDADEEYYKLPAVERSGRKPPAVDPTVVSEYNAAAVSALIVAARAFPAEGGAPGDGLLVRAIELGRLLAVDMFDEVAGQLRFREAGEAHGGLLGDNLAAARAFLDLHDATQDPAWLGHAERRLDWAIERLFDGDAGMFRDRVPGPDDVGLLKTARFPFGANALAADLLVRAGRDAMRADLFGAGRTLLARLGSEYDERMGPFAAPYGSALLRYWRGKAGKACLPGDPSCSV
jgi:uncharacterized protein YyaL (SSP411 family)